MSITESVGGYFIHLEREGIVMRCRKRTRKDAEECLKQMREDIVVDLPRVRYYFHPDKILILRKPNHTDHKYKCPYISETTFPNLPS